MEKGWVTALFRWFSALLVMSAVTVSVLGAVRVLTRGRAEEATADGYTVVVDAGHGGADGGAVGTESGEAEAGLNLAVAKLLEGELTARGLRVVMTRTDENALAKDKKQDFAKRREIMRAPDVDLVVSVHMNKFGDRTISGAMAYYMLGSAEGQKLAQKVIDRLTDATGRKRRLANPGDYYVIRECPSPAVLVECGFLSNAAEEKQLLDADYQALLAAAIADGVCAYLGVETLAPETAG